MNLNQIAIATIIKTCTIAHGSWDLISGYHFTGDYTIVPSSIIVSRSAHILIVLLYTLY